MIIPLDYCDDRQAELDELADLFTAQKPGWKWGCKRHLYGLEYVWAFDQLKLWIKDFKGKTILDAGGGRGALMGMLAVRGADVITCARRADRLFGTTERGVRIPDIMSIQCDMADVPFDPASYDAIVAISSIEHNPKDHIKRILEHLTSLLKPGAPLVVTVPVGREERWYPRGTWPELPNVSDTMLFTEGTVHDLHPRGMNLRGWSHPQSWTVRWDEAKREMDSYPGGHVRPYLSGGFVMVRI